MLPIRNTYTVGAMLIAIITKSAATLWPVAARSIIQSAAPQNAALAATLASLTHA